MTCHLMITFSNSLDLYQAQQSTLMVILKEIILKKLILKKYADGKKACRISQHARSLRS